MEQILEFINGGQVEKLSAAVFNQKLEASSSTDYTRNLSLEEEVAVARQFATAENPTAWAVFLKHYIQHYPLFNPTIELLIQASENKMVQKVLSGELSRYGCNEQHAHQICNLVLKDGAEGYTELLCALADHGRCHFEDIAILLQRIDDRSEKKMNLAARYQSSIEKYWQQKS